MADMFDPRPRQLKNTIISVRDVLLSVALTLNLWQG